MSITGLSHVTFVVRDVERSANLWCKGLGAEEIYDSKGRNFSLSREKFFLLLEIHSGSLKERLASYGSPV